ncbi:endo-exonuclease [Armillaria mellea]|nr:endo-exonuclease [Armillaria mellea]
MLKSVFIATCLLLVGVHALPTELSNATATWNPPATKIVERAGPTFTLDYEVYPQSSENICFSWFCNNGPHSVAPDRTNAAAHRASNSCGNVNPNRCSVRVGHIIGFQCDEWPWANSNAGGANAATRCIPAADNTEDPKRLDTFYRIGLISPPIEISNVPTTAGFCKGVLGTAITPAMCSQVASGQPYLQKIG